MAFTWCIFGVSHPGMFPFSDVTPVEGGISKYYAIMTPVGKTSRGEKANFKQKSIGTNKKMNEALRTKALIASLVAVVTFVVFLPTLQNGFVNWDDDKYVYENSFIRSLDTQLLKSAFFRFHAANWHPLTWLSHALDYSIWGLNPLGHHLTNNILHSLNALLVALLVMRLIEVYKKTAGNNELLQSFLNYRAIGIAGAFTGLLFGLHPLHVESVAWVAERKDLLCALFFLLSIMAYLKYSPPSLSTPHKEEEDSASRPQEEKVWVRGKWYLLALCFFVLALLSKPMAVSLPVVLLILDWYPLGRIASAKTFSAAIIGKLPFFALSIGSSVLTIMAQKAGGSVAPISALPLSIRLFVAAKSLIAYLWKMMMPLNLVPLYPYPRDISFLSLEFVAPVLLVVVITVMCIVMLKKEKLWFSLWLYYAVTLIPVLGVIQVGDQSMADRYTYLPSLGPFLIIGVIAAKVYEKVTDLKQRRVISRMVSLVIALAILVLLPYTTIGQISIWKDSTIFWNYVIEKEPERAPAAHNNLGNAYASQGQLDRAISEYETALRLKPDYADAHYNLGNAYASQGQLDRAIVEYQTTLQLKPDYIYAHNNLGLAYASQGQLDRAIAEYQTVLQLKPDYAKAHYNLGLAYASQGQLDRAIAEYQTALQLKPDFYEASQRLNDIESRRR